MNAEEGKDPLLWFKKPLETLVQISQTCIKEKTSRRVLLYGYPGYGKTEILKRMLKTLEGLPYKLVWCDGTVDTTKSVTKGVVYALTKSEISEIKEKDDRIKNTYLIEQMQTAICECTRKKDRTLILIIENFKNFVQHDQNILYPLLDSQHDDNISLLFIATDSDLGCLDKLEKRIRSRFNSSIINVNPDKVLTEEDKKSLFISIILEKFNDYQEKEIIKDYFTEEIKDNQTFEDIISLDYSPRTATNLVHYILAYITKEKMKTRNNVLSKTQIYEKIDESLETMRDMLLMPVYSEDLMKRCTLCELVLLASMYKLKKKKNIQITLEDCWKLIQKDINSSGHLYSIEHEFKTHEVLATSLLGLVDKGFVSGFTQDISPLSIFRTCINLIVPLNDLRNLLSYEGVPTAVSLWIESK